MTNDSLNFATLEQGKLYKKLQKKIIDGKREKTMRGLEGMTSFKSTCNKLESDVCNIDGNNSCSNQYGNACDPGCCDINSSSSFSFHASNTNNISSKTQKLSGLQVKFNSLLAQYQQASAELTSEVNNYNDKSVGKNVYVNSIINNPTANYIGIYKDVSTSPAMEVLDGGAQTYSYSSCMQAAINSGKKYFGLENAVQKDDDSKGIFLKAQCNISNDLTEAQKYGIATNGCEKGSDGNMYGGFQKNVMAAYDNLNSGAKNYRGCFNTSSDAVPNMQDSGINMASYSSVYVLGSAISPPWSVANFPDPTAQWIWYVPNAQTSAPVNAGAPITFIYGYNYTGTSYINATVYALNDDSGDWYLNSIKQATITGGWDNVQNSKFDITLAPGMNYLQCMAINNSGPAGLIATVIRKDTNEVLFNTNSDWKFTNIPVDNMAINASNYSVDTCQQYAAQNKFNFFGLKNGSNGTSQCVVSNDVATAFKYGFSDPTLTSEEDNQIYGSKTANAIYEINNKGANLTALGKAGYTVGDLDVSEYPASMISKTDSGATIIGGDSSCPKDVNYIDSVAWSKMKNTGKLMSSATKCGIQEFIEKLKKKVNGLKGQLAALADEILEIITELKNTNTKINNKMRVDTDSFNKNIDTYKEVSVKFGQYKSLLNNNQNLMLDDSKSTLNYENYKYIFWVSLAVIVLIMTIKVVNQR
jgi:hypothetical protein